MSSNDNKRLTHQHLAEPSQHSDLGHILRSTTLLKIMAPSDVRTNEKCRQRQLPLGKRSWKRAGQMMRQPTVKDLKSTKVTRPRNRWCSRTHHNYISALPCLLIMSNKKGELPLLLSRSLLRRLLRNSSGLQPLVRKPEPALRHTKQRNTSISIRSRKLCLKSKLISLWITFSECGRP